MSPEWQGSHPCCGLGTLPDTDVHVSLYHPCMSVARFAPALTVMVLGLGCAVHGQQGRLAPYVPTPPDVVDRMLSLAAVTAQDVVYDLGSGDGRIVIAAAKTYGARGIGIEIDPTRIKEARENARRAGVERQVTFRLEDATTADISAATVVTLYLLTSGNQTLKPTLERQLRSGTRVVSHAFPISGWTPEKVDKFTDSMGDERIIYLWRIP